MTQNSSTIGTISAVSAPLITVTGLTTARPQEKVLLENGSQGLVLHCDADTAEIMLLDRSQPEIGTAVRCSHEPFMVPVGRFALGKVLSPLGKVVSETHDEDDVSDIEELREADTRVPGLQTRTPITDTLHTGVSMVDLLLTLAKGQRQMVIGDRKTGKSPFLLQALLTQVQLGSKVVFCFIGKRQEEIAQLHQFVQDHEIDDSVCIVASSAFDASSVISLTPFTAMTLAEYFRDQGDDVLIIFDDLTTHAKYYREIALLGRTFPGRDSYPGDIFYVHARLLERAGNFRLSENSTSSAAITALPVAETLENELTDYIVSNLMSITDGHLLFDTKLSQQGIRPPIDNNLSVTRVGKQTLPQLVRAINRQLSLTMNHYEKLQRMSHFGNELSEKTRSTLQRGAAIQAFFNQEGLELVPADVQVILATTLLLGWWDQLTPKEVVVVRYTLSSLYRQDASTRNLFHTLLQEKTYAEYTQKLEKQKKDILKLCKKS